MTEHLDAETYLNLVRGGAARLAQNRQTINDLNVFPIPDGDTGDNMYMTIEAGSSASGETLSQMASAVSSGMLLGARGNSGVILSLLFRGTANGLKDKDEADGRDIVSAFHVGVEMAYKAVTNPTEGTILTVARMALDAGRSAAYKQFGALRDSLSGC